MSADEIDIIVTGLKELTDRTVKKIVLDCVANLKETTPFDTGWARANWVPSVGTPYESDGINPALDSSGISGSVQQQAGVQTKGEAELLSYKIDDGPAWIANNVPYIKRLDEGHSKQAPAGFVRQAIEKAVTQDIEGTP